MKCAVYEYVGSYGGGLLFIPVEDEKNWMEFVIKLKRANNYDKVGEMDIDENVIHFRNSNHHPDWGVPNFREANYTYEE